MNRLTWRRQARDKGLARLTQGERGYDLVCNGEVVGRVRVGYDKGSKVYYFYAGSSQHGIRTNNSVLDTNYNDVESAKAACKEYVSKELRFVGHVRVQQ